MKIYNTLTKKIEEFIPKNNVVTMYTCGPTVYNYAHIGNLRTYIFEDVLEKSLNYLGYKVKRAMNITDVGHLTSDADTGEDKMVKSALKEHKTPQEIAAFYTDAFFKDFELLNIKKPEIVAKATDHIDEYIKIISKLLETGYAYKAGGNIYFDISKMPNYYELSGKNPNKMLLASRDDISEDANKRNPFDFVLWFTKSKFENQDQKWDSPFGVGYPGWHIECASIASKYLGEYLDIHCGGVDLIFPHHTNEIAEAEAYFGHKWCNYFVYGEYLNDSTGKMSKSKGDFLTLDLLIKKGYHPLGYRYFCLASNYRKTLEFSYESLEGSLSAYLKLRNKTSNLSDNGVLDKNGLDKYILMFEEAINNDLNTSSMLTLTYELLKDSNLNDITKKEIIRSYDQVLSLDLLTKIETKNDIDESYILSQIEARNIAKTNKEYEKADMIRKKLESKNIYLKDTKEGTTYEVR